MFGISFGELALIALVALLVLGPERLPGAARTAGLWVGRIKRSFNAIRQDIERELGADEIRRQLHNEQILELEREMRNSIRPPATDASQGSPQTVDAALHPQPRPDALPYGPAEPASPAQTPEPPRQP
jgi:sec-independent protein translocase protein TatB